MKLTTIERLTLLNMFPERDNIVNKRTSRRTRERLSFSDEEQTDLNFVNVWQCPNCKTEVDQPFTDLVPPACPNCEMKCPQCGRVLGKPALVMTGKMKWDTTKDTKSKDFKFGGKAKELIRNLLTKLSSDEEISDAHISLYDKFIGKD